MCALSGPDNYRSSGSETQRIILGTTRMVIQFHKGERLDKTSRTSLRHGRDIPRVRWTLKSP